jgi:hypothetical protein
VAALPGQRQRDLTTDAAAAAGDEGDRLRGRARHGLSAQKRKKRGRVPDASSRDGSDRHRTRGGALPRDAGLLLLRLDDEDAQPVSATRHSKNTSERRRFMRPFYRGIRYI